MNKNYFVDHDAIVFQHPFYWYSCPALLKEWIDLVLEYGFRLRAEGTQLQGKLIFSALTTGGPEPAYTHEGYNQFTMRELLAPFEQTARLCGMTWLPPFIVHGTLRLFDSAEIESHALDYVRVLSALRDGKIPERRHSLTHAPQRESRRFGRLIPMDSLLLHSFIYLGAAIIVVPIAKRFGLGAVLGYLLAGVLIGPHGLSLVGERAG